MSSRKLRSHVARFVAAAAVAMLLTSAAGSSALEHLETHVAGCHLEDSYGRITYADGGHLLFHNASVPGYAICPVTYDSTGMLLQNVDYIHVYGYDNTPNYKAWVQACVSYYDDTGGTCSDSATTTDWGTGPFDLMPSPTTWTSNPSDDAYLRLSGQQAIYFAGYRVYW